MAKVFKLSPDQIKQGEYLDEEPEQKRGLTVVLSAKQIKQGQYLDEERPEWLDKGSKPAPESSKPEPRYPQADIEGARKALRERVDASPNRVRDFLGATGAAFNEVTGVPAALMDVTGVSSPAERRGMMDRSTAGEIVGRTLGTGADLVAGPGRAMGELVSTGAKAIAPLAKSAAGKAAVSTAGSAATGGATEAARAALEGEDIKGIGKRAAIGTAAGAVTHGAVRGVGGWLDKRQSKKAIDSVLEGATAREQDRALAVLGGKEGLTAELKASPDLARAAKSGHKALEDTAGKQADDVGAQIGKVYEQAEKNAPGIQVRRVVDSLEALKAKYAEELDVVRVNAIQREIEGIKTLASGREFLKASSVHKKVSSLGRGGYEGGSFTNPSDAKALGREMHDAVRGVLQGHVDDVAAATGKTATAAELKALNQQFSKLTAIEDLAEAGARRGERGSVPLGKQLKGIAAAAGIGGIGVHTLTNGDLMQTAVTSATVGGLYGGAKLTAHALAALYRASTLGHPTLDLLQQAIRAGVPSATAEAAIRGGAEVRKRLASAGTP